MLIDCGSCAMRDRACADCVVTALLNGQGAGEGGPVQGRRRTEVDEHEARALAVLADSGLVPRLRLVPLGPPGRAAPPRAAAS